MQCLDDVDIVRRSWLVPLAGQIKVGKTNIHPQVCSRGGAGGHLGEEAHSRVHTSVRTPIILSFFIGTLSIECFKLCLVVIHVYCRSIKTPLLERNTLKLEPKKLPLGDFLYLY